MKLLKLSLLVSVLSATGLSALNVWAQEPDAAAAGMNCRESITVFQDVSGIGRKDRAAKNISKKHREMAQSGWRFIDMEVYTENGDLEGFYLSYTRDTVCDVED